MRALVLGGAGFVGRHLVAALLDRGYEIHSVDLEPMKVNAFDFSRPAHLHFIQDALGFFRQPVRPYNLVVHAAARSPHRAAIDGDPGMHPHNVALDAAMFDWAIRTGQPHVLYLSSCAALDGPVDDYAATKLTGERLAANARAAGVKVTVVRPYSGYGEDQSEDFPFRAIVERARRRENPFEIWGDGTQVRDWIHIDDVVAGALAVAEAGVEEPVSLCTGFGTSMRELAELACHMVGYKPEFRLRLDKPAGVAYRVGNPECLNQFYTTRITLAEGVRRALEV